MHFRAFIGAVSLKPIQRAGFGGIDNDFRAFIGAVSLKRHQEQAGVFVPAYFRAFIGAVSLKRCAARRFPRSCRPFPRLHRRGLIEADAGGTVQARRGCRPQARAAGARHHRDWTNIVTGGCSKAPDAGYNYPIRHHPGEKAPCGIWCNRQESWIDPAAGFRRA